MICHGDRRRGLNEQEIMRIYVAPEEDHGENKAVRDPEGRGQGAEGDCVLDTKLASYD